MMNHNQHRAPVTDTERKYNDNHCKLFVGGLTPNTTDEMMKNFYSQFGAVLDCVVKKDPVTGRPRGFGFVTLSSKEEVDKAMKARPHEIDGRTVDPKRATPRSEESVVTASLFVSNLRPEFTKEDLEEYFNKYGKVVKVVIPLDKVKNEPRGFAFVTFDDYDAVDKCVLEESHTIRNNPCYVKKDNKDVQQNVAYNRMKRTAPWNESYGMPMKRGDRYASWQHGQTPQWKHGPMPTWSPYGVVPPAQNRAMPSYAYGGYGVAVPPNTTSQSWYQGGQFNNQYASAAVVPNAMTNSPASNVPWYAYTASVAIPKNHADVPAAVAKLESNGGT
ncbi:RNA recognition motif domain-containing protein [Ditylenchus destructor]|nr:RNA recognition motif domain-containing protein [Ditylenchus destructor]